jgi:hypothetical protein
MALTGLVGRTIRTATEERSEKKKNKKKNKKRKKEKTKTKTKKRCGSAIAPATQRRPFTQHEVTAEKAFPPTSNRFYFGRILGFLVME